MRRSFDPIYFTVGPEPGYRFLGNRRLYKDSGSPPAPPDPYTTAAAQTNQNTNTAFFNAALNRPTQITPYGSQSWTQSGGGPIYNMDAYNQAMSNYQDSIKNMQSPVLDPNTGQYQTGTGAVPPPPKLSDFQIGDSPGQWTSTIQLNPTSQQIFDNTQQGQLQIGNMANDQLNRIQQSASTAYNPNFSQMPNLPQADEATRAHVEQALIDRMAPYQERDRAALEAKLANQGFTDPGASGYQAQMDTFNRGINDARLAAIGQAGNEEQRQFQMQSQLFGLGQALHQQQLADYERQRYAPLNEYNAFRSASQIQTPQFGPNQPVATSPANIGQYIGDAYTGQQNNYNQQVATNNANTQAGASLAAAAMMAAMLSDRRLKTDILPIGEYRGLGVYQYRYLNDPEGTKRVGVMADEVRKVIPSAVHTINGFDVVDYGKVLDV